MPMTQTRRRFLATVSMAGGAGSLRAPPAAAEGALETTTVRLLHKPTICGAPQYVAEELLRAEGFTDISYTKIASSAEVNDAIIRGEADFDAHFAPQWVSAIDGGGADLGFGGRACRLLRIVRQRTCPQDHRPQRQDRRRDGAGVERPMFVSVMAANIGLDPVNDIRWVASQSPTPAELFARRQDRRLPRPAAGGPGSPRPAGWPVVVNSAMDRPWSQYFCCMVGGQQRVRAQASGRDQTSVAGGIEGCRSCAPTTRPRVARRLVDDGFTPRYDYALQTLKEIPYDKWREYDHEDTLRFYALRLHEAGMIKSSPQKIIADGTDWRFLNELKRELKA